MLRSFGDLQGVVIDGADGAIGSIDDLYFDDRAWAVRFLKVKTDAWLEGREVLISPVALGEPGREGRVLSASVTRAQVRDCPDVDTRKPVSRQHETEQYAYYGYPYYWGGSGLWGDGLQPRAMLETYSRNPASDASRREADFVLQQEGERQQRGDDPHLRSARALIRYHVRATDGEIGHVDGLIVDDRTWAIHYCVVNTSDWWLGHRVLVAPRCVSDISWLDATASVELSRDAIRHCPEYDPDALPEPAPDVRPHQQPVQPVGGTGSAGATGGPSSAVRRADST